MIKPMTGDGVPLVRESLEAARVRAAIVEPERFPQIAKSIQTDDAFRVLFQNLIDTIEYQETGVLKNVDSECLHDFRITLRRTRTLLSHAKKALPARRIKMFSKEFRWLSDATGPARDIDVQLLYLNELQKRLPTARHANLGPVHDYLNRCQRTEYEVLSRTLNSVRYRRLKRGWRAFLAVRPPASHNRPDAMRSVCHVAPIYIAETFGKVAKQGRELRPDAAETAFHELRKTSKKLRYLLEFFKDVMPKVPVKKIIRELKHLLDRLGAYQDLIIQKNFITRCRADITASQSDPMPVEQALEQLIATLADDEIRLKKDCIIAWQQFSAYMNRKRFKKLLHP